MKIGKYINPMLLDIGDGGVGPGTGGEYGTFNQGDGTDSMSKRRIDIVPTADFFEKDSWNSEKSGEG